MDATRCRCNATQIEIIGRETVVCKEWEVGETKTSVGGFGFRDNNGLKFEPYDGEGQGDYGDNMVEE